jgi:hypothetical protein
MRTGVCKPGGGARPFVLAAACALALCSLLPAAALGAGAAARQTAAATLEQCTTAIEQSERSATFVGEMTAIPGTARMLMRIEVLQRTPAEPLFRPLPYPGISQWLRAAPGVHTFKNLDRVTDLPAPALYRAAVHFRWLNARGRTIRSLELRTGRCDEPAPTPAAPPVQAGASSSTTSAA